MRKKITILLLTILIIFAISCEEEDIPHYWRFIDTPLLDDFYDNYAFDYTSVWMCGVDGVIIEYDAVGDDPDQKVTYHDSKTENTLYGIDFFNKTHGFAVGELGTIVRFEGNWNISNSNTERTLYDLSVIDDDSTWVVGEEGVILNYAYNEENEVYEWSQYSDENYTNTSDLYGIDMFNDNFGVICGSDGVILVWDGSRWSEHQSSVEVTLRGVKVVSTDECYIVGDSGTLLKYDGDDWGTLTINTSSNLSDVDLLNGEGWIVSQYGDIFYFDGNSTERQDYLTYKHLSSVHIVTRYDAWICGFQGMVLRYY